MSRAIEEYEETAFLLDEAERRQLRVRQLPCRLTKRQKFVTQPNLSILGPKEKRRETQSKPTPILGAAVHFSGTPYNSSPLFVNLVPWCVNCVTYVLL